MSNALRHLNSGWINKEDLVTIDRKILMKAYYRFVPLIFFFPLILPSQPKIYLENKNIDLDTIYHGEVKTVYVIVGNTGDQPLRISHIETSCGCTSAGGNVPVIEPGANDTVSVSFNSLGFDGRIRKEVMIYSNDPSAPMADVNIFGIVASELEPVPKTTAINFGIWPIGNPAQKILLFRNTSGTTVAIGKINCADPNVTIRSNNYFVGPSDTVSFTVTVTPRSVAPVDQLFYVETSSPRQPRIPFRFIYGGK